MSGVNEIRSAFLAFFAREGHEIVASGPLVPRNDPTLMFANSGMVQFKNVFTGAETKPYRRAATAQKCVRAGGKHNDLDNVGYTARHHTFFEMLGNFSFGDYFKAEAIDYAWRLITKEYGLPKDRLIVTVYADDEEAHGLWKKVAGVTEDRIIRISTSDNFWRMGETGPCGPCSEIFFDHGDKVAGGPPGSADADGDRFIEIWNLVFMQYEELPGGVRQALPRLSIDTGMGLERVSAVLQGTHDNFRTDTMRALIRAVAEVTGSDPDGPMAASHRIIADHLRCSGFLIADGVLPSNEGRGYVVRRIMRRAMRHAELLGAREPVLWRLVPALVREMGQAYPELVRGEALIGEVLKLEETAFRRTLERGLVLLEAETRNTGDGGVLSGDAAFKLYDTFGFPLDLTQDALRPRGIKVDVAGFDAAMAKQKAEARRAWSGTGETATDSLWFALRDQHGATEFLGYATESAEGAIAALVAGSAVVDSLAAGAEGIVVLNQTPFYAESGGQVGDSGILVGEEFRFRVTDTQKRAGDVYAHIGTVESGTVTPGSAVVLTVDTERRHQIRSNHSATHLLHEALRQVLGDHVAQKGSLVSAERLRFDIAHPQPIDQEALRAVEDIANAIVLQNAPVVTRLMAVEDAMHSGARALFGEKYGDEVRVVSMGRQSDATGELRPYSVELCGGTHVAATGEIGLVSILSEGAVSAGVRRLEAVTGQLARQALRRDRDRLESIASLLKVPVAEVSSRVASLAEDRRRLERELQDARRKLATAGDGPGEQIESIQGVQFLGRVLAGVDVRALKTIADDGKRKLGSGVVALVGTGEDGKAGVVVAVTDDLTSRFDAIALVRAAAERLGGNGGGGRRDMAQAGGPDGAKAEEALDAVRALLASA